MIDRESEGPGPMRQIPIVAFFGTKGGVGKTTIARRVAELVTQAGSSPNLLAIDFDIEHRGLTVTLAGGNPFGCHTMHDYIAARLGTIDQALDVSDTITRRSPQASGGGGRLFLIPASTRDSRETFRTIADIRYPELVDLIRALIDDASAKYDISCVIIDCGPTINPYTAAAAHLADRAFIIGQNEPISYESLQTYAFKIREFYPDFNSTRMSVILNKVRGNVPTDMGFFHIIPFTIDVVDITEGIEDINTTRLMLFDRHILEITRKIFERLDLGLVPGPEVIIPPDWRALVEQAPRLLQTKQARIRRLLGKLLYAGGALALAALLVRFVFGVSSIQLLSQEGVRAIAASPDVPLNALLLKLGLAQYPLALPVAPFVFLGLALAVVGFWFYQRDRQLTASLRELTTSGEAGLLEALDQRSGRRLMDNLRKMSKSTSPT